MQLELQNFNQLKSKYSPSMAQKAPERARSQHQDDGPTKYVLVLYTGGTIGMIIGGDGKLTFCIAS